MAKVFFGHEFPIDLRTETTDYPIQLRISRTNHVSATNHKSCQFVGAGVVV